MNYEEFMKYVDKMDNNIRKKLNDNEDLVNNAFDILKEVSE